MGVSAKPCQLSPEAGGVPIRMKTIAISQMLASKTVMEQPPVVFALRPAAEAIWVRPRGQRRCNQVDERTTDADK